MKYYVHLMYKMHKESPHSFYEVFINGRFLPCVADGVP